LKWIIRNGLILYIALLILTGLCMVIFLDSAELAASTWTFLLLTYILLLSSYKQRGHTPVELEKIEDNKKN
jgi:hypothetical protein